MYHHLNQKTTQNLAIDLTSKQGPAHAVCRVFHLNQFSCDRHAGICHVSHRNVFTRFSFLLRIAKEYAHVGEDYTVDFVSN